MEIDKKKAHALFVLTLLIVSLVLLNINGPTSAASPTTASMYWKESYPDYAPSGIPDFDQKQDQWDNPPGSQNWTWCAPTSVANSLWWMDSRYETSTTPPPTKINTFPLVSPYGPWDDHHPNNTVPLIEHLAYLMDTDGNRTGLNHTGTNIWDMQTGIAHYLSWTGLNPLGDVNGDGTVDMTDFNIVALAQGSNVTAGTPFGSWNMAADIWPVTTGWPTPGVADNVVNSTDLALVIINMNKTGMFYEQTLQAPDFYFIEDEIERSEDVNLGLGFWQWTGTYWSRESPCEEVLGHAVTVAGVNSTTLQIAISDPGLDAFEAGTAPGRSPVLHPYPHSPTIHNNASLVSHDIYNVTWVPPTFPAGLANFTLLSYSNPQFPGMLAAVEWAVIVSPLPAPSMYWKESYPDYAPSGIPDFDQKQDQWDNPPGSQNWTWCGSTAVANSLWWMDSRYETSTTPPPTIDDTFPLVTNYTTGIDDHDPLNVPPFIEHLAYLMDTDGNRTGTPHFGTDVFDMEAGIAQYLSWTGVNPQGDVNGDGTVNQTDYNIVLWANNTKPGQANWTLAADIWPVTTGWPSRIPADNFINQSDLNLVTNNMGKNGTFYEHTVERPDFHYIEEEVERCQDVVLLLGFWRYYGEMADQMQKYCEECKYIGNSSWQEFVPTTANWLSRVDVKMARTYFPGPGQPIEEGPITMTIERPLGTVLTSKSVYLGPAPGYGSEFFCTTNWVSFDIPYIRLTPGQSYYIRLTRINTTFPVYPPTYHWCGAPENRYTPGISNVGGDWDWTFVTIFEEWERDHGHYVTVAGVNSTTTQIAFSDPYIDAFEAGTAPGRSPVLHPYPHNFTIHNNASLVSHDIYNVTYDPCPGGDWTIIGYPEWEDCKVQIEYAVITSPLAHDIAVTNVLPWKTVVGQQYNVKVNVTVENQGYYTETFNITVYANTTVIATLTNITLSSGNSTTLTITWNTTSVAMGNYTITAKTTQLPYETDTTDNTKIDGIVEVVIPGDINADEIVDVFDAVLLAGAAGSTPSSENWNPNADINSDLTVDVFDAVILAGHAGQTYP